MQVGPAKVQEHDIIDVATDDTIGGEPSGDVEELFEIVKFPDMDVLSSTGRKTKREAF
jgi:hypothetical protein